MQEIIILNMDNKLRQYTRKRIKKSFLNSFFEKFSITNWIIIVNVVVYLAVLLLLFVFGEEKIIPYVAISANDFFSGKFWTLLTSMFVHIEFWHLLANMFSLFFIGNVVEKIIQRKRIFWLYLVSGLFAGLFYVFLSYFFGVSGIWASIFGRPDVFAVGASGAIFSLLGLLAVLTPRSKVYLIAGPLIAIVFQVLLPQIIPSPAVNSAVNIFVTIYIFLSLFSLMSFSPRLRRISLPIKMDFWVLPIVAIVPLVLISFFVELPIGNSAHLGGLICGLIYAFYLKNKYKDRAAFISKFFSN